MRTALIRAALAAATLACLLTAASAQITTAVLFEGTLLQNNTPANGVYDIQFRLFNASSGGTQVGNTVTKLAVPVTAGEFSTDVDFGSAVFTTSNLWVEISARVTNVGDYVPRTPRIPALNNALALYAHRTAWSGIQGIPAGFADGVDNNNVYTAGLGLVLNGTQFQLNTTYGDSRWVRLGAPNSVTQIMIAANSVNSSRIIDNSVSAPKLATATPPVTGAFVAFNGSSLVWRTPVTSVVAGTGLTGGATSGAATLNLAVPMELSGTVGAGLSIISATNLGLGRGITGAGATGVFGQGQDYGVYGVGTTNGVYGIGIDAGVWGTTASTQADDTAIRAVASGTSGRIYGLWATNASVGADASAVYGDATAATGSTFGVFGRNASSAGVGVYGFATSANGSTTGVWGRTSSLSGSGVVATGAGNQGLALTLVSGGIRVSGAGINTGTPVFIHRATVGNINSAATTIDHPQTNSREGAILIVTINNSPGGYIPPALNKTVAVQYDAGSSRWQIVTVDGSAMPVDATFNVMVVVP